MSTKPEALRLADLLEQIDGQHWQVQDSAAAELRRLVAENQALRRAIEYREAVPVTDNPRRDAMLAALQKAYGHAEEQ